VSRQQGSAILDAVGSFDQGFQEVAEDSAEGNDQRAQQQAALAHFLRVEDGRAGEDQSGDDGAQQQTTCGA